MSMQSKKLGRLLVLCSSLAFVACGGGGGGGGDEPDPAPAPAPAPAAAGGVTGVIVDAGTGAPVVGATVSNGSATAVTDSSGNYTLSNVATTDRAVLRVNATGYAEGFQLATVVAGATEAVQPLLLLPVGVTQTVSVATGGTVSVPESVAQVTLSANSLARADGTPATGNATVSLTAIDPTQNTALMPGDFTTDASGTIESFGAINVAIKDEAGNALNLASGQSSTIRIPLTSRNANPETTIPLYYFNEETGRWVQQGEATLQGTAPNQYYAGTVTHFSVWNADKLMDTVFVSGCVNDEAGVPVVNASIRTDGIDYSGSATAMTDATGKFRVAVKKSSETAIVGRKSNRSTNAEAISTSEADYTMSSCLTLASLANAPSIKLTWGEEPSDIDSHLYAPNGSRVYYGAQGALTAAPYAALDVDDTSSYGPEIITFSKLMVGTYTYAVHNFSGTNPPGITGSPVRVELQRGSNVSVYNPPAGEGTTNEWWVVFSMQVDAQCNVTVTPVGTWSSTAPSSASSGTAQYCSAP